MCQRRPWKIWRGSRRPEEALWDQLVLNVVGTEEGQVCPWAKEEEAALLMQQEWAHEEAYLSSWSMVAQSVALVLADLLAILPVSSLGPPSVLPSLTSPVSPVLTSLALGWTDDLSFMAAFSLALSTPLTSTFATGTDPSASTLANATHALHCDKKNYDGFSGSPIPNHLHLGSGFSKSGKAHLPSAAHLPPPN